MAGPVAHHALTPGEAIHFQNPGMALTAINLIDSVIQITADVNVVLDQVMDAVLEIFKSSRAALFHPCNPQLPSFDVTFESTTAEYPGAKALKLQVPMTNDMADYCHRALSAKDGPEIDPPMGQPVTNDIAIRFNVRSMLFMALRPRSGEPWMFLLHQCDRHRIWTSDEKQLFHMIGQRITSCINNLLYVRQLKASEFRFRSFVENANDIVYAISPEGLFTYVSPNWLEFMGEPADEAIGNSFVPYVHPDDVHLCQAFLEKVLTSGQKQSSVEYRVKHTNGSWRWHVSNGSPMKDLNGNIAGYLGIARDVTEKKQTEKAILASEKKYRTLVNTVPYGIQLTDREGKIIFSNPAHHKIQGYADGQLIGKYIWELMADAQYRLKARSHYQKLINEQPRPEVYFNRDRTRDGRIIDVQINWDYIRNEEGEVEGIISIISDITKQKALESGIQQAQRMESIGNLAGGIAHDFNNILFPIIGMSEMLTEDLPPGSPETEFAEEILKAAKRGSELVKQILAFSRRSEHKMIPTHVQQILKEVIHLSRSTIPTYIQIRQDIQPDCGMIMGDPAQIHQVAMNIITNAYHAMEDKGGVLSIRLDQAELTDPDLAELNLKAGHYAVLTISDTGHGIPNELMDSIFEPYFTTKAQGKGTGLGLAVVYGIVKEHMGNISVCSEVGKGTTFHIYLPLMGRPQKDEPIKVIEDIQGGDERILVVDDEASIAIMEKKMLERLGYNVTERLHSIEALQSFKASPYNFDLVVTDMSMPSLTGIQLAEQMLSIRTNIPIIICTGYSERINKNKATSMGVKGFLMKPIFRTELAKTVRQVLDEARGKRQQ